MSHPDYPADQAMDAELRAVPVPDGFVERLRRSVLTDEELDTLVRTVPVPDGLADRLGRGLNRLRWPAKGWGVLTRGSQWAAALSLLLALTLGFAGIMAGFLLSVNPGEQPAAPLASADTANEPATEEDAWDEPLPDMPATAERRPAGGIAAIPSPPMPMMRFQPKQRPYRSWIAEADARFGPRSPDPLLDTLPYRWGGVFASHRPFDELPGLKKAPGLTARGIEWPLVTGANNAFLIRQGVHPFVSPASSPQLRTTTIPLGVDAASYELTKRWLEDGELPPPQQIRTEEFLAALDYEFPKPTLQPLSLALAGGPSPLGGPGTQLLQIGAQAAAFQEMPRAPVRLVLAVDCSANMRWGGRFDMVRQALQKVIRQMGRRDRMSIVAFSEDAEVVIEDAGADESSQLLAAVRSLKIGSATNVGAGLCQAYSVAQRTIAERGGPVRVVLLTDGLTELDAPTAQRLQQQLTDGAKRRIVLDIVDLSSEKRADRQLADFARAGGGALHGAADADAVRGALLETITGRPQIAAAGVSLKVSFDPNTVAEYRLLGHEAAAAGTLPDRSDTDFCFDRSAVALYEVHLKPGGGEVARVELTWQPAKGGPRRSLTRRITRSEFAGSYAAAPLSLQEAAVAAGFAEVLRDSPFARMPPNAFSLARVLDLANQVDSRLSPRRSLADMLATIEQAARAKPYRGGAKR